jgi:hypothetical protein
MTAFGGRMRTKFKKSLRETLLENQKSLRAWSIAFGKPIPEQHRLEIAPKRTRAASNPAETEAPVLAAVGALLASHPQVLLAVRQNSGGAVYERDGREIPIWFYKLIRKPSELTFTDYWGFLRDGRPFAIECKRPSWKAPHTPREMRQQAFMQLIEKIGGVGGFVRSADEVMPLFPSRPKQPESI